MSGNGAAPQYGDIGGFEWRSITGPTGDPGVRITIRGSVGGRPTILIAELALQPARFLADELLASLEAARLEADLLVVAGVMGVDGRALIDGIRNRRHAAGTHREAEGGPPA